MTFLTTTAVKRLVVDLLKSIAKQTTNTMDDKAVEILVVFLKFQPLYHPKYG